MYVHDATKYLSMGNKDTTTRHGYSGKCFLSFVERLDKKLSVSQ